MTTALVPVKRLSEGKSRLHACLDRETIVRLSTAMLEDVLSTLLCVKRLKRVGVVTPDADVARIAKAVGAEAFVRTDPGLNASLAQIAQELFANTPQHLMVFMADLPGARHEEVEALLQAGETCGERGVVLAPTHDRGTAALLRIPHDVIPTAFGPQSADRHAALAARAGAAFQEIALASLALDMDEPHDLNTFLRSTSTPTRTREILLEIQEKLLPCNPFT